MIQPAPVCAGNTDALLRDDYGIRFRLFHLCRKPEIRFVKRGGDLRLVTESEDRFPSFVEVQHVKRLADLLPTEVGGGQQAYEWRNVQFARKACAVFYARDKFFRIT